MHCVTRGCELAAVLPMLGWRAVVWIALAVVIVPLSARGFGPTEPVAGNDTDDGRARNRRVELVLAD